VAYSLGTIASGGAWVQWAQTLSSRVSAYGVFDGKRIRIREVAAFVRACRALRPHVIYVVGLRAAGCVRLLRPLLACDAVVHGIRSSFPAGSRLTRWFTVSERLLNCLTTHYVANTEAGAGDLRRIAPSTGRRLSVIRNGIPLPSAHAGTFVA